MKTTDLIPQSEPELIPAGEGPDIATLQSANPESTLAVFDTYKEELQKLKATADKLTVTSVEQTLEIRMAKDARLALKKLRCEVERVRKAGVDKAVKEQRKWNDSANELKSLIEPLENRMQEQEDFVERENQRLGEERRIARECALAPYTTETQFFNLASMPEEAFQALLTGQKAAFEVRIAETARLAKEAQKAEEDRIAKEKAEAEERERVRLENERLKKEALERDEASRKEREAAEEERKRLEKQVEDERKAAEAKAAQERAEAEKKAKAAADKARKEREEIEAKAKLEREQAEAKAKKDREALEEKARHERAAREKLESEIAAKKEEAAREEKAKAESARVAAAAPDKKKLAQLAIDVRALAIPDLNDANVKTLIESQRSKFAAWIEKQAEEL